MGDNYEKLVLRIAESAKLNTSDIERRIEAKRAKLSGLVSKEGAAQIVAAELGINFDQERMKISEVVHGMKRVNVIGKIIDISPVREYNKNGRQGKVCNLLIADESSNVKTVLWDTHHIGLIESGKLSKGDVVEISNAGARNGEIHLGGFSDIKKSKEVLNNVIIERDYGEKKLKDAKIGMRLKIRAVIVNTFEPKYFEVCSKCGKKPQNGKCLEHENMEIKKRAVLNIILDDGTDNIRSVLFGEQIKKIGLNDEDIFSLENFAKTKEKILGEEMYFSGSLRNNELFNNCENPVNPISKRLYSPQVKL